MRAAGETRHPDEVVEATQHRVVTQGWPNPPVTSGSGVALGTLAVERGSSDTVKQFGRKMVDDHTMANDELKQLVTAGGVNVLDALDSKHQARVAELATLSGAEFDKAYIKDQVKCHHQNVKVFQQEAQYGSVQQVKILASKSLPTLQQRVELAGGLNTINK
jgi:putative membrane protein